ncbi:MAG: DUF2933 domain-containing protein [Myxococcota bacterium]
MAISQAEPKRTFPRIPWTVGACVFLAIGAFFLWEEHRAHLLGALPYLLLLACPLMHLFMHHGHGGQGSHSAKTGSHDHGGQP